MAPIFFNGFFHSLIAEEAPDDFRYQVEVLDQSIRQPMELELAPDGRVFVNDFKGGLYLIDPKSDEQPIQVAQLEVFNEQENGFLGSRSTLNLRKTIGSTAFTPHPIASGWVTSASMTINCDWFRKGDAPNLKSSADSAAIMRVPWNSRPMVVS